MFYKLLLEAIVVGISVALFGTVVSFVFSISPLKVSLPPVCKDWNKNYIMELSLFLTGFLLHFMFESIGLNKWYCKYGNACRK